MGLQNRHQNCDSGNPYSLVFRRQAVLLLDIQHLLLKVAVHEEMTTEEKVNTRLDELEALDEDKLAAQQNRELYRQRMSNEFNKQVQLRYFKKVLVLVIYDSMVIFKQKGKLEPNWEAPFIIENVYSNQRYLLMAVEGDRIIQPTKKYYPQGKHAFTTDPV